MTKLEGAVFVTTGLVIQRLRYKSALPFSRLQCLLLACKRSLIIAHGLFQFCDLFTLSVEEPHPDFVGLIGLTSFEEPLVQYGNLVLEGYSLSAMFLVGS
jgi:hypothetical protein